MTAPSLRRVAAADVVVLAALHARCFPEAPWDAGAMADILGMPGSFGLLAHDGNAPGGLVLARLAAGECEILSIGELPALRRRGWGCALLRAALRAAAATGATCAHLEVAEDNASGLALYLSLGMVEVGRRSGYYRRPGILAVDALLLSCPLSQEPGPDRDLSEPQGVR